MADLWIQVGVNFPASDLVDQARQLGLDADQAIGKFVRLWVAAMNAGCHGRIGARSDDWIEEAVGWRGERGAFAAFVRERHLDAAGAIPDWFERYGSLEEHREKARLKKQRQRALKRDGPGDAAGDNHRDQPGDVSADASPISNLQSRRSPEKQTGKNRQLSLRTASGSTRGSDRSDDGVDAVLAHYVALHPARRPGPKDRAAISRALKTYSATELCDAISGNAADDWHVERRKHELTYVLRDNGKIDDFRERHTSPARPAGPGERAAVAAFQAIRGM